MHSLRVNFTFYDVVNMIHDVIKTANPFPCTVKFMFGGVKNNKTSTNQMLKDKYRIWTKFCRISKISNSVGRNDNFLSKARKLSILPSSLDILIYRNTMYVFSIYTMPDVT